MLKIRPTGLILTGFRCKERVAQTLHPPPPRRRSPGRSYTPRGSFRSSSVLQGCRTYTSPPKGPVTPHLGAGSMKLTFSTIKFLNSVFYCHGVCQEKQRFGTIFLSAPNPPPSKNANFIFIVVSPSLTILPCRGGRGVIWTSETCRAPMSGASVALHFDTN